MIAFACLLLFAMAFPYAALSGLKSVADIGALRAGSGPLAWDHFLTLYLAPACQAVCVGVCLAVAFAVLWLQPIAHRFGPVATVVWYGALAASFVVCLVVAHLAGIEVAARLFRDPKGGGGAAVAATVGGPG